nr:isoform 2 of tmv resistance protein n [Quercus suber]
MISQLTANCFTTEQLRIQFRSQPLTNVSLKFPELQPQTRLCVDLRIWVLILKQKKEEERTWKAKEKKKREKSQRNNQFLLLCSSASCNHGLFLCSILIDRKRIVAYRDDRNLPRGGEIGPELLKAIETSRIAVVVFSKSYATSDWCLDELVKIMECKRVFNQSVLPIFYDVSQSVVLEQKGVFAEAVLNGPVDKVNNWRTAMTEAANLAGFHLEHRCNF